MRVKKSAASAGIADFFQESSAPAEAADFFGPFNSFLYKKSADYPHSGIKRADFLAEFQKNS